MCEFDVLLNGRKVFEGAINLRRGESGSVMVSDAIGHEEEIEEAEVIEVDVPSERLVLK